MEKVRNLSIRKTIVLYLSFSLVIGFLTGVIFTKIAEETQQQIWQKYTIEGEGGYEREIARVSRADMTDVDVFLSEACDFFETYSILVFSFLGMLIAVFLFYRNKIAIPLNELTAASELIGKNELDFQVTYSNRDELGRLCAEFERMRASLAENNQKLWKMVEEEKALRAAIAHDIRSPLAVLKGYQEMLIEFVPDEKFEQAQIVEMLQAGLSQIERIDKFIETMRKLSSLEERVMDYKQISLSFLTGQIRENIKILEKDTGIETDVVQMSPDTLVRIDKDVVLEVIDNLVSNALRYAKQEVFVGVQVNGPELEITVSDDGCGFQDDAKTVTRAYYHSGPQDELQHFGMGMYISRVYCERHKGRLLIGGQRNGGAVVKAVFKIDK